MKKLTLLLGLLAAAAALAVPLAAKPAPNRIALPDGFRPEGIDIAPGGTFYVGSIPTGAIYRGSVKTGKGAVFIQGAAGRAAIGVDESGGRLFVAGGPTGKGFAYDARTGMLPMPGEYQLAPQGATSFVNDVIATRGGAYFTDSSRKVLYRVPIAANGQLGSTAQEIPLTGDIVYGAGINANGIDATADGKTLVIVQTNTGKLFRVDPASGVTREIRVNQALVNGDGILLKGRTLFVVQNQNNRIAVVKLAADLSSGTVTRAVTSPTFDVPTTIAEFGSRLYAVNARFSTAPTATTPYWISVVKTPKT
jgi:sugar lactone lactonase YvrE